MRHPRSGAVDWGPVGVLDQFRHRAAAALFQKAGLHGHQRAIDAMVAEVALRQRPPVAVLTSDIGDMVRIRGPSVRLIDV